MKTAEVGNRVKVHYTGKRDDGTVFDSSRGRDPLEFIIGENQLIKGFESTLTGMTPGDKKTVKIPAEEAYGSHRSELVVKIDRAQFPDNIDPQEGLQLKRWNLTISLGVATCPKDAKTFHPLVKKADKALYASKRKGKNCVTVC